MKKFLINILGSEISATKAHVGLQMNDDSVVTGVVVKADSIEEAEKNYVEFENTWGDWIQGYNIWIGLPPKEQVKFAAKFKSERKPA